MENDYMSNDLFEKRSLEFIENIIKNKYPSIPNFKNAFKKNFHAF